MFLFFVFYYFFQQNYILVSLVLIMWLDFFLFNSLCYSHWISQPTSKIVLQLWDICQTRAKHLTTLYCKELCLLSQVLQIKAATKKFHFCGWLYLLIYPALASTQGSRIAVLLLLFSSSFILLFFINSLQITREEMSMKGNLKWKITDELYTKDWTQYHLIFIFCTSEFYCIVTEVHFSLQCKIYVFIIPKGKALYKQKSTWKDYIELVRAPDKSTGPLIVVCFCPLDIKDIKVYIYIYINIFGKWFYIQSTHTFAHAHIQSSIIIRLLKKKKKIHLHLVRLHPACSRAVKWSLMYSLHFTFIHQ